MLRLSTIALVLLTTHSGIALAAAKYIPKVDPQALAVAQAAFNTMGGTQALLTYSDSLTTGKATLHQGDAVTSYPITLKSKGLTETRVELQMTTGTNVRIINNGQGANVNPDGRIRILDTSNTFYEHVNHIPLLSLLAEYAKGQVNLLYIGVQKIQDQSEDVVEIDFVPTDDPQQAEVFGKMSQTLFYVNQSTKLVDKIQSTPSYEHNAATVTDELYLADYRWINGMLIPFHQSEFIDGKLLCDTVLDTVNINVGLSDADFVIPQPK